MQPDNGRGRPDANDTAKTDTIERPAVQRSVCPPGEKPLSLALSRWSGDGTSSGTACGTGGR